MSWNRIEMRGTPQIGNHDVIPPIRRIQQITIAWMIVEAAVSLLSAWRARSPALLAFGGDSAIELVSAIVVLWRFTSSTARQDVEFRAARIAGVLLFALVVCILATSLLALLGYSEPKTTILGIAILVTAALIMPLLAKKKRHLAVLTNSAALRADAAESAVCGYLSLIALAGLLVGTIWHVKWADPAAALLIIPFVLREALESIRGRPCECG